MEGCPTAAVYHSHCVAGPADSTAAVLRWSGALASTAVGTTERHRRRRRDRAAPSRQQRHSNLTRVAGHGVTDGCPGKQTARSIHAHWRAHVMKSNYAVGFSAFNTRAVVYSDV